MSNKKDNKNNKNSRDYVFVITHKESGTVLDTSYYSTHDEAMRCKRVIHRILSWKFGEQSVYSYSITKNKPVADKPAKPVADNARIDALEAKLTGLADAINNLAKVSAPADDDKKSA